MAHRMRLSGVSSIVAGLSIWLAFFQAARAEPESGEKVYQRQRGELPEPDTSGAPRLALHAAELGFAHPLAGQALQWSMPLPPDLQAFLERLRGQATKLSTPPQRRIQKHASAKPRSKAAQKRPKRSHDHRD